MQSDLIKEYNSYLEQLEMILHPNLYNGFLKIHNEIVKAEMEQAKTVRPSKEWVELKKTIDTMRGSEPAFKSLYLKSIIKQIDLLPVDKSW